MSPVEKKELVRRFYKSWETVPFAEVSKRYAEYLSDDIVFEVPGSPPYRGIESAVAFMDSFAKEVPEMVKVLVDIKTLAADGDLVFNERIDSHCDAQGKPMVVAKICSAMEVRNGKIARWTEYLDPKPFHDAVAKGEQPKKDPPWAARELHLSVRPSRDAIHEKPRYNYRLISFNLCPFVQRAVILLLEKDVEPCVDFIDIANKPPWFLEISPSGRAPLLQVGDRVLTESNAIVEFIDETTQPRLMPDDPFQRAEIRAWTETTSDTLGSLFGMIGAMDQASFASHGSDLKRKIARFEQRLEGPFFDGAGFSLVDAVAAPMLQRVGWIDEIAPDASIFDDCPKVNAWRHVLASRPSVQKSTMAGLREVFIEYLKGRGTPSRNTAPSWIGRQI